MYDTIIFTDVIDTVTVYKAIGAYKIANTLRQHGYTCLVVDHLHSLSLDEAKQIITKYLNRESLFVGFSTTFASDKIESELITHIKSINNNCKIVLGGTKATSSISNKNIDYSIISYGEKSIVNLANHLRNNSHLETYKNIFGVNIIDGRKDTEYDFVNSKFHWTDTDVGGVKVLPIEISRGCIFKCKFCSYPLNGKQNLDFIRHSDNLYEELHGAVDPIAEEIRSLDTYAPGSMSRFLELTEIEDELSIPAGVEMARRLMTDNERVIATLNIAFKLADTMDKQGLADFIAGRIDVHNKHGWMLRSITK